MIFTFALIGRTFVLVLRHSSVPLGRGWVAKVRGGGGERRPITYHLEFCEHFLAKCIKLILQGLHLSMDVLLKFFCMQHFLRVVVCQLLILLVVLVLLDILEVCENQRHQTSRN